MKRRPNDTGKPGPLNPAAAPEAAAGVSQTDIQGVPKGVADLSQTRSASSWASVVTEDQLASRRTAGVVNRHSRFAPGGYSNVGFEVFSRMRRAAMRHAEARVGDVCRKNVVNGPLPLARVGNPTAFERPCNPAQAVATTVDFHHGFQTSAT